MKGFRKMVLVSFHLLLGFWLRFLVDVKVREVERRMHAEGREFGVNPQP